MRTWLGIVVAASALAACADGPAVASGNERSIVIKTTGRANTTDAFSLAERHCNKFGRVARPAPQPVGSGQAAYDCVQP